MGLDMQLKKMPRSDYESISVKDFWITEFNLSEELIYWRKRYDIDEWLQENTSIYEQCSDEITKEKLKSLVKWLKREDLQYDAIKVNNIIKQTDFESHVVFYSYCF